MGVNSDVDWYLIGYIKASKYRSDILISLNKKEKTPKELKNELGIHLSHISTTLKNLKEKQLVVCLTPDLKKGKIFSLTEKGLKISNYISND